MSAAALAPRNADELEAMHDALAQYVENVECDELGETAEDGPSGERARARLEGARALLNRVGLALAREVVVIEASAPSPTPLETLAMAGTVLRLPDNATTRICYGDRPTTDGTVRVVLEINPRKLAGLVAKARQNAKGRTRVGAGLVTIHAKCSACGRPVREFASESAFRKPVARPHACPRRSRRSS